MAVDLETVKALKAEIIAQYKEMAKDGLSVGEYVVLGYTTVGQASILIERFASMSGAEKKRFCDDVAIAVWNLSSPFLFTGWFYPAKFIVDPFVREILPHVVEAIYQIIFKKAV